MSRDFAKLTATKRAGFSTFLLGVALDQERVKQSLATALRGYTGRDDPIPRITQPDMLKRLNERVGPYGEVTLRTYQRYEVGEVMPKWDFVSAIADEVGTTTAELIGDEAAKAAASAERASDGEVLALLDAMDRRLRRIERKLERLAPTDEPPRKPAARAGRQASG